MEKIAMKKRFSLWNIVWRKSPEENLMTNQFDSFNLHPRLVEAVTTLGYNEPTPVQSAVIPLMIQGEDVIGQAQTGTGKTAAFGLPILNNLATGVDFVQCLILTPTRELALQVATAMEDYGQFINVKVLSVYGGTPYNRQIGSLKRGVDIVVGTPGRLLDLIKKGALDLSAVSTVVLDEADEMLSMGFIEDIEAILDKTPSKRQTALFSATIPQAIRRLADRYLKDPKQVTIQKEQMSVEAIEQRYYLVNEKDKLAALSRLFEVEPITSALIFTRTRASSGELANELTVRGFPAEVINGDLAQETREQVLNRFRQNQIKVLVATDVAARGLDIEDISHVFNYDLPEDVEVYVHRIGRTGRAGKSGVAISLVTPRERGRLRRIEKFARHEISLAQLPSEEDIVQHREKQLLGQVEVWLNRGRFRRERELVAALIEAGHDPWEIAAAALKVARADEKQRPIAPVSAIEESRAIARRDRNNGDKQWSMTKTGRAEHERKPRRENQSRKRNGNRREGKVSHEFGMVRLALSRGRSDGIHPNEVVSTIAYFAEIPGSSIGKINIEEKHTLVDVPEMYVGKVLQSAEKFRIQRMPVTVELA